MEKKSNGMAVASLVTGICSIVLCWVPILGLVSGILGIVFFVKAKKAIEIDPSLTSTKGMATGGMITGIIGLVFSFFYTIAWILILTAASAISSAASYGSYH